MPRRYFTVAEVDRLVPRLEQIFVHVLQLRASLRGEEEKLAKAGVPLSPDLLEEPGPADAAPVRQGKLMFQAFYDELSQRLSEVERLGGQVKDLQLGLVDFLGRRGGEDILLCWKLGERKVEHWHSPESGFGGRQPIDDEVAQEPPPLD